MQGVPTAAHLGSRTSRQQDILTAAHPSGGENVSFLGRRLTLASIILLKQALDKWRNVDMELW